MAHSVCRHCGKPFMPAEGEPTWRCTDCVIKAVIDQHDEVLLPSQEQCGEKQWKYKIIDQADGVNPDDVVGLDYLGNQGWELVAISKSYHPIGGLRFYFKKEVTPCIYGQYICEFCGYSEHGYLAHPCPRCGKPRSKP